MVVLLAMSPLLGMVMEEAGRLKGKDQPLTQMSLSGDSGGSSCYRQVPQLCPPCRSSCSSIRKFDLKVSRDWNCHKHLNIKSAGSAAQGCAGLVTWQVKEWVETPQWLIDTEDARVSIIVPVSETLDPHSSL